jgi:hypothetical protein
MNYQMDRAPSAPMPNNSRLKDAQTNRLRGPIVDLIASTTYGEPLYNSECNHSHTLFDCQRCRAVPSYGIPNQQSTQAGTLKKLMSRIVGTYDRSNCGLLLFCLKSSSSMAHILPRTSLQGPASLGSSTIPASNDKFHWRMALVELLC